MLVAQRLLGVAAAVALAALATPTAYAAHGSCASSEGEHPMFFIGCGSTEEPDSNGGATNLYDGSACTGGAATNGKDVVWYADMQPGWALTFTLTPSASVDAAIFIATDCDDMTGSCVAGADAAGVGGAETMNFTSTSTQRFYVICDGVGTDTGGDFNLSATLDCNPISVDEESWGLVKELFQ